MNSRSGKIVLALTALMLVQHGVRHLLLADDRLGSQQNAIIPLLNAYHPFPSLPRESRAGIVDPTPVQIAISVSAGQVVAIGSLDRSIRLHDLQLSVHPQKQRSEPDQIWFDVANVPRLPEPNALAPDRAIDTSNGGLQSLTSTSSKIPAAPASPARDLLPPNFQTSRRFELPFFREGNVYQRTLIRELICYDNQIAIYGDPQSTDHVAAADAILQCGIPTVLKFVSQSIGKISDLDGDGRLALVLGQLADAHAAHADSSPMNASEPKANQEPIRGCVRPADFQKARPDGVDAIYLDPRHLQVNELQSLLAHEFAHAATFSLLVESGQPPTAIPGWLNEAIAHYLEQQIAPTAENLQQRRRLFQAQPWMYPAVIPEQFTGMALRRGPSRIASLELLQSARPTTVDKNLRTLITCPGDGINRLVTANRTDFKSLFRNFTRQLVQQRDDIAHQRGTRPAIENLPSPAFRIKSASKQAIQIRGTAVAISSPADQDCELLIKTTRDAMLQITVIQSPTQN
ncbi:MAG: hypothetical protein ABJZ55_06580 [Fuerstiella sp.]